MSCSCVFEMSGASVLSSLLSFSQSWCQGLFKYWGSIVSESRFWKSSFGWESWKIDDPCSEFLRIANQSVFLSHLSLTPLTPRHILCQNTLFKLGLLCLHQTHELPPTCKDLHNMTIWNIRVQYQRTVMTAISKNQRCSKQTEVQKGQNMPNMQDVFSAEFQSSNLTCIHGTKMQDLNHAHSRFFLASTATQMTFMRIHTPTMPAAIITWVRLTTLDVFHVHILKKLRCRQRLREHTKQSAHRR